MTRQDANGVSRRGFITVSYTHLLPVFAHRRLSDAEDGYFAHGFSEDSCKLTVIRCQFGIA